MVAFKQLPKLPVSHDGLVGYIAKSPETPMEKLMEPFRKYEAQLREVYAQDRSNPLLDDPYINVLPLFTEDTPDIRTRARNLALESPEEKDRYIMSLPNDKRRPNGSPAVVESIREFRHNFNIFSESSLVDLDWSNVVAAGSSAVNCLLPVPQEYKTSKRALRQYYHEKFCPASDVDLFLYGLTEEQAIEKIKQIETNIRDAILTETTVVRTKNAITICSQYPTRHVQIVLRVYKSISEILTGFDIDCSGAAYDGQQVYCTPRALASYITQINPIDLSRRSPSYENRLSKYSHRNFEVYWPELDRSKVDPTIFERSFSRTLGLARLLVLERLPTTNAREQYMQKRREERGRPALAYRYQHTLRGNIKDSHEDEVADWVNEEEVSNYHTFTIPYGEKFHAKKIEKLCYTRDLLLNAEWNQPKEREVHLHRHPAFFGRVQDTITDCCGTCPKPVTPEEIEIAERESEIYVSGNVSFRIDDPGRQQIGSFNPLTDDDWTEMAYVGNTARLCQAIVDGDLEHVEDWLSQEGADPNQRDYTGRTPLHLAVISSTPKVVKCLVDHGARLVARLADGRTALHLAASRGDVEILKILLEKSSANEEAEADKQDLRRKARAAQQKESTTNENEGDVKAEDHAGSEDDSEAELLDDETSDDEKHSIVTGSFVKVNKNDEQSKGQEAIPLDDESDPDFYAIDVIAWDSHCSALHYAILGGHTEVVKLLCQEFAADVLGPVKYGDGSRIAILTLVLALALPVEKAMDMAQTLLSLGATSSQADVNGITAFHRYVQNGAIELIDSLLANDKMGLKTALNHVAVSGSWNSSATSPLMTAIDNEDPILVLRLLEAGANHEIDFESWMKGAKLTIDRRLSNYDANQNLFQNGTEQPLILAVRSAQPNVVIELLERGADPNTLTKASSHNVSQNTWSRRYNTGQSALDLVRSSLETLRGYEGEKTRFNHQFWTPGDNRYFEAPEGPQGTAEFLDKFSEGTYQHYAVYSDVKSKVDHYEKERERFENERKKNAMQPGMKEKKEAINDLISQLESVESALLKREAKTFQELYPDVERPQEQQRIPTQENSGPYKFEFNFSGAKDITDVRKTAYIDLLEAAWRGDLEKIKSLTLASWGDDGSESPLKIAVCDIQGNNPFSLAFLRGHFDVARAILDIAHAQWAPEDESNTRYKLAGAGADNNSVSDDSEDGADGEPQIFSEIVDDQYTIENIGQVSTQVKSGTSATTLLNWDAPAFTMVDGKMDILCKQNMMDFSIATNDNARLQFLVDMEIHLGKQLPDSEEKPNGRGFYALPVSRFRKLIALDQVDMLADMIERTGAGIPLEHLVKKSGVEMKRKPRYYQGLTVYGKKRADWANAGRNLVTRAPESEMPPLLEAAKECSFQTVEWFLSDEPMKQYVEFGKSKAAKEDLRLKHLSQSPGGFDRAIAKWLGAHNDLVIHHAILGQGKDQNRLVKYLVKVCPSSLEVKSEAGYTPLFLACLMGRPDLAKILIDAGADQSVKDKQYNNIIHAALTNRPKADKLRELLDLLDPDLRTHMFVQRNSLPHGGDTPLHFWLKEANPVSPPWESRYALGDNEFDDTIAMLRLLLEYSNGTALHFLNGAGDTPLHTAVQRHLPRQTRILLEHNPALLWRENAVGRTPGEMAHDRFVQMQVSGPQDIDVNDERNTAATMVGAGPETFVEERGKKQQSSRKEQVWSIVQEYYAREGEGETRKRRLVSLNEANDVARRLGESYSWQRYASRSGGESNGNDGEEKDGRVDFVGVLYSFRKGWAWVDFGNE